MNKKVMRIIGALLLTTALVVSLIPVSDVEAASSASDFQITGNKLMRYTGTAEVVSIPAEVKSIETDAFRGNPYLVKVNINERCEKIGYGAFSNCPSLRTVVLSDRVEEIDSAAFANDISLTNFSIGSGLKKIGSGAFAGDKSLFNLSVSSGNTHLAVKNNILYDDELKKIYLMLPGYIDPEFFMPNSVEEVAGYAFWGNTSLVNVSLSSNMYNIPEFAFSNCVNLKQVTIPLSVKDIDAKAFEDCVNLRSVKCPETVRYISDSAFDGCPNVTINAQNGSYAYNFGQKLLKDKIDEIEYEDVEEYNVVTSTTERSIISPLLEDNESEVIEGHPDHDSDIDSDSPTASPQNEDDDISVNEAAKYGYGVINGSDVITYKHYNVGDESDGNTLGYSSVVGGSALVFIDNSKSKVRGVSEEGNISDVSDGENIITEDNESIASAGDIDLSGSFKNFDFPKFTIAGNNIASQAYYNDKSLETFEIPENITKIGEFAFSRTGLTKIKIPDGVTDIGYGAFYHCDSLKEVSLPNSIEHVSAYAFSKTPFVEDSLDAFVIAGDGILVGYKGNDSVVNIPEGVKIIADGVFQDRMGITAVNFPDSLKNIGQNAFSGCGNLRTLNRGDNIETIGANAFKDTSLNNVTIPASVKEIGIGAFNLKNGTDTVTFKGGVLPTITEGYDASRLANSDDRNYVFGSMSNAVVQGMVKDFNGTVLESGKYGFKGVVKNEGGAVVLDNTQGVSLKDDGKVSLFFNSAYFDDKDAYVKVSGSYDSFYLKLSDSQNAKEAIALAYADLYGGMKPDNLLGVDLQLLDASGNVSIEKLGKQKVEVTLRKPAILYSNDLHVVCLDDDGQLESVEFTISEDGESISFTCKHFSPYGFYNGENANVVKTGTRVKDDTPDTGDLSIHPKFFLAIGLFAAGIFVLLLSNKKRA